MDWFHRVLVLETHRQGRLCHDLSLLNLFFLNPIEGRGNLTSQGHPERS
jgi:hypothetical protein